jgi:hypothetical protein
VSESGAAAPAAGTDQAAPPADRVTADAGVLLVIGLIWLGTRLWSAHANVHDAAGTPGVVIVAAYQLPDLIAASMLAGAGCGLAGSIWWTTRRAGGPLSRTIAGGLAALIVGLLAGGLVVLGYGGNYRDLVLAGTVAVAGLLGGALAGLAPARLMAAGVVATLAAFVVGVVLNFFQSRIVDLFGPGATAASHLAAANRAQLSESLLAGVIAGLAGYLYLRRRSTERRFPGYLAAGGAPGLLLLLSELVARLGGAQLYHSARLVSPADDTAVDYFNSSRLNHALVVLFAGMIVALLAFGRSLPRRTAPRPRPAAADGAGAAAEPGASRAGGTRAPGARSNKAQPGKVRSANAPRSANNSRPRR